MADTSNILSDFGINLLEEEIDDVIFQTNESSVMPPLQAHKAHFGGFFK